ncbi:DUF2141 domain-containing protein [Henriciella marina]|jgi:uncharacterized protein (DUF2141 family)|uniref:DUF2141 domain-containing protein n=1 Tax=Henriciella marina TaxID=453851 RepID=A0ABT4LVX0_9PROT|nr:DUF2141 domain-containing protein [Henriciella marina]MCZ4298519.1 DUF2141 domain-containing protein [Henriciella marina]
MLKRIITTALIAGAVAAPAVAAPLTVTLEGVEDRGVPLYVGVQTEEQFMKWDGIAGEKVEDPEAGTVTVSFDLPEGEYSVSVWHDLNDNGEFDMNENGWPEEGYAMSNQAALRGMPTFDVVKVAVDAEGATITETVNYPQ